MTATLSTQAEWFSNYVSSTMSVLGVHEPDSDGDLPVRGVTSPGWVRVQTHQPWGARIFAYAATGVPAKVAVYKELNAAMLADRAVRVFLTDTGAVVVDQLVLADAVGTDTLRRAVKRVLKVADRLGPVLTALHGGSVPLPPIAPEG